MVQALLHPVAFFRIRAYGPKKNEKSEPPFGEALAHDLVGLSISGGGIRSATLSLGILQGLAQRGLLKHIDYLSTVSGGGYIGSWLTSWIYRIATEGGVTAPQALADVQSNLVPDGDPNDPAREPIHQLRRYSNYLTPDVSLLNADTWTLAAIWARNTLLNLVIVIFLLGVLLILPRFARLFLGLITAFMPSIAAWLPTLSLLAAECWLAGACLLISVPVIAYSLNKAGRDQGGGADQKDVQRWVVLPLVIAAAALAEWLLRVPSLFNDKWQLIPSFIPAAIYCIFALFGNFLGCFKNLRARTWKVPLQPLLFPIGFVLLVFFSYLAGLFTAAMFHLLGILANAESGSDWLRWAALCLGPPLVLSIFALGTTLQAGLMGHDVPDASREWMGRLRAWTLIYSGAWLAIVGISVYGPWVIYQVGSTGSLSLGAIWGAVSASGLFAGKAEDTGGQHAPPGTDWKSMGLDAVAKAAPYVFVLGFATLIALGIHELVSPPPSACPAVSQPTTITLASTPDPVSLTVGRKPEPENHFTRFKCSYFSALNGAHTGYPWSIHSLANIDFYNLGSLFWLALLGGLLLAWRVDINDFSMHHFYKNRLVRCYLGASRKRRDRHPNPFTGFDGGDDHPLADFAERKDYCGPYPILNGALNLAGDTDLAWQERQAASFVFTPLYCGYDKSQIQREAEDPDLLNPKLAANAYTPTKTFAYDRGIGVGTAMGISGAAANPNSGYHTSPAVAFLLTIFNARLGWWLGNPARYGKADNPGPKFGLTYLITELFGLASANKAYVNVSDGGHFENLGIYELVKRRCRYIIACDGEQDGEMKFEGLAGAIRKCRTDFGVEIDIDVEQLGLKDGFSNAHCVVGRIKYPEESAFACLLYFKASLTGNEDTDVLQYHSTHPAFPHQSTTDQWFDESQFESYRKLGVHIAESALSSLAKTLDDEYPDEVAYSADKENLFRDLRDFLYPPSDAIKKSFTKHTGHYMKLIEEIAKTNDVAYLDAAILGKWLEFPLMSRNTREGRYLCVSFLQLMENVYLDLQLDDPTQRDHPHNAGWLTLFRKWANQDAFKDAWKIAGETYGNRFRKFYLSLIDKDS